jgi:ribosomal protein L37AE/L43A
MVQYCPECGRELVYEPAAKRFACRGCGLYVTREQLWELKRKIKLEEDPIKKKKREHAEYLEWWLSKK